MKVVFILNVRFFYNIGLSVIFKCISAYIIFLSLIKIIIHFNLVSDYGNNFIPKH